MVYLLAESKFIFIIHPRLDKLKKEFLYNFFDSQIDGYRQANVINTYNKEEKFMKFENQIIPNVYRKSKSTILHYVIKHPMLEFELDGKLNIPIYLINDFPDIVDFEKVMSILFPRIDLSVVPNDFELSYSAYDSWRGEEKLSIDSFGNFEYYDGNRLENAEELNGRLSNYSLAKIIYSIGNINFYNLKINTISTSPKTLSIKSGFRENEVVFFAEDNLCGLISEILNIVKSNK